MRHQCSNSTEDEKKRFILCQKGSDDLALVRDQEQAAVRNDGQFGPDYRSSHQLLAFNETGGQALGVNENSLLGDEGFQADNILVNDRHQNWNYSDRKDAVIFGEKADNTANYHHQSVTLKQGDAMDVDDNYLDGPVLPNLTATEANAGQISSCEDPSSGFGCDGNRLTFSFTNDSSE